MEVTVLEKTDNPERLVCQAARGDYFDGFVGETEYTDLMEGVDYDESHLEGLADILHEEETPEWHAAKAASEAASSQGIKSEYLENEIKTRAFIEKQLSRGHYGPWEHPQITFAVEGVSRVTMAQITRHRHMTFDVQSQRYVDFSETEAIVPKALRDPDHFSRETGLTDVGEELLSRIRSAYKSQTSEALGLYEEMVDEGIPKEDARFVLPVGTPVNMTFSGNARTFMHLLDMRKKANAQWEIRQLSEKLIDELMDWMPYTYNHYEKNAPHKLSP